MGQVAKFTIPGVQQLPKNLLIVTANGKQIQAVRNDGLTIFLDREPDDTSQLLNRIRLFASVEQVLHAVGLVRGFQVSISYAKRYRPESVLLLETEFARFKEKMSAYSSIDGCSIIPTAPFHRLDDALW